jgi:hypothetical protein
MLQEVVKWGHDTLQGYKGGTRLVNRERDSSEGTPPRWQET